MDHVQGTKGAQRKARLFSGDTHLWVTIREGFPEEMTDVMISQTEKWQGFQTNTTPRNPYHSRTIIML